MQLLLLWFLTGLWQSGVGQTRAIRHGSPVVLFKFLQQQGITGTAVASGGVGWSQCMTAVAGHCLADHRTKCLRLADKCTACSAAELQRCTDPT